MDVSFVSVVFSIEREQLLEVHVDQSPRERESPELASARQELGYALCNRSVANFKLGNPHSGEVTKAVVRHDKQNDDLGRNGGRKGAVVTRKGMGGRVVMRRGVTVER